MFEREIAQTIRSLSSVLLKQQPHIRLSEILDENRVPNRVKVFFAMEVNWWIYNESLDRAANNRFDFRSPELASLVTYLEQVQFRYAQFDRDEFSSVLDSAVKLMFNFLCRPQTTLKWFIFRGQPVKPLDEVLVRLEAFSDYPYFRSVFNGWVERKRKQREGLQAISAAEFERVIRRIDDQILLSCTVEDLLELMDPIFEILAVQGSVPVSALVIFFDDKNIQKLVGQLEKWRAGSGDQITHDQFVSLLEQLLDSSEDQPDEVFAEVYQNDALDEVVMGHLSKTGRSANPADEGSEPVLSGGISESTISAAGVLPTVVPEVAGATEDTQQADADLTDLEEESAEDIQALHEMVGTFRAQSVTDVEMESGVDELELLPTPAEIRPDAREDAPPGLDAAMDATPVTEPISMGEADADMFYEEEDDLLAGAVGQLPIPAEHPAVTERVTLSDITVFIDSKLENKILRKFFHKDQTAYSRMLHQLNNAPDWPSAERVLSDTFTTHNVEPYSRTAIRLTDCVYARYLNRPVHQ